VTSAEADCCQLATDERGPNDARLAEAAERMVGCGERGEVVYRPKLLAPPVEIRQPDVVLQHDEARGVSLGERTKEDAVGHGVRRSDRTATLCLLERSSLS
jgi:hypothetical protein